MHGHPVKIFIQNIFSHGRGGGKKNEKKKSPKLKNIFQLNPLNKSFASETSR